MITYSTAAALAAVASLLVGKQEKGLSERAVRAATWAGFAMGGKFVLNTLARPIGAVASLGDYNVSGEYEVSGDEPDPWATYSQEDMYP